jgi:hypothetical protein
VAKQAKPRSRLTRSGTRRLGDDYQDVVALDVLLDWLEHTSRYRWVRVEADDAGALDDVAALRGDGTLVLRQVKFSTDPESKDDPWSWERLLQRPAGKGGSPGQSLLQKWADSLDRASSQGPMLEAAVLSNRRPAPDLASALGLGGFVDLKRITDPDIRQGIEDQLGGEARAGDFFARFQFRVNEPSLAELEEGVRRRFYRLGGTESGWLSLKEAMRRWVCYRNEPPPEGAITLPEVKRAARWNRLQTLPQRFEIPPDYVLPSREFHDEVVGRLLAREAGCLVLKASPGVGKSTYSSYLYEDLQARGVPVVRHHYFLSVSDRSSALRLDHERAAESLMHDLLQGHARALGDLARENPRPSEGDLRAWIEACGRHYAGQGTLLAVIVDGLDHVWRERRSVEELDRLLGLLLPSPDGVVVFLATQPVDESMLPSCLLRAAPRERWLELPPLDGRAMEQWLGHHRAELSDPGGDDLDDEQLHRLAEAMHRRSRGHPLHLRYTLKAIQERGLPVTESSIEGLPGCPHEDITAYYRELWRGLPEEGRELLHLLAACRFPWPPEGLLDCQDPQAQRRGQVHAALKQIGHLLVQGDLGLQPFHGSLLVFVERSGDHAAYATAQRRWALEWLRSRAPEHWAWSYTWRLAADLGDDRPLLDGPCRAWAVAALADRRSRREIEDILSRALWSALRREDLPRGIELGLLREYLSNAHEPSGEVLGRLLFPQLLAGGDPHLRARLRAEMDDLSDVELRLLAEAEARDGDLENLRRCFHELVERSRGRRSRRSPWAQPGWRDQVTPILEVAALPGGPRVPQILDYVARNRENGLSGAMLAIYAERLRASRDAECLRAALAAGLEHRPAPDDGEGSDGAECPCLTDEERSIVLQQAVLLALEEDANCDPIVREHAADPLALIYAALRGLRGFAPGDVRFPDPGFLSIKRYEYHERTDEVRDCFERVFYCFLANHLWARGGRNAAWLATLPGHYWAHQFVRQLDGVAADLSGPLLAGTPPALGWFFERVGGLARPKFRGNSNITEYSYSTTAAGVALRLGLDLLALRRATGGRTVVTRPDLEAAFASGYCHRESWINLYLARRRPWLTPGALGWLLDDGASRLGSSIDPFPERAERYTELASLAALHGRREEARDLIGRAADNLLAHGAHKDMLFADVLDSVRAYHRAVTGESGAGGGVASVIRTWVLQLAPAIAAIEGYTDGDETGHLPRELADALAEIAPDLLPDYYRWLSGIEDYYDALHAIRVFVRTADLSHPIAQAVARTAVDEVCLRILSERAQGGDGGACSALDSLLVLLGPDAVIPARPRSDSSGDLPRPEGDPPKPAEFPPERLSDLLAALRTRYFDGGESLGRWADYWAGAGRGEEALDAIAEAVRWGERIGDYDAVYTLAVRVRGGERAYPWLAQAHREGSGWSRYYAPEAPAIRRWEIVRERYPERWFEFLRDTLVRGEPGPDADAEPWRGLGIGHHAFLRIVEYCLFMGRRALAERAVAAMVGRSLEMVSPLTLLVPGWAAGPQEVR